MRSFEYVQTEEIAYLFTLAMIWLVVLGGMLTPVTIWLTRPFHPLVERLARRAAWSACKAALARAVPWIIAVATASSAVVIAVAVVATPVQAQSLRSAADTATTTAIERMIGILDKAAKHPMAQTASLLARGYTAVKVYRLSKEVKGIKTDVAELQLAVHAVLLEVTSVLERVETGETLTAGALAEVNSRIDIQAARIAAAEVEIELLKQRLELTERRQMELSRQQREAEALQREAARRLSKHQKRIGRPSKTPNLYFEPKTGRHLDARDRPNRRDGIFDVRTEQ